MSEPRGHHIVAQLYQRGFARQRGRIWQARVLERGTGAHHVANIAGIFKQRDWNTLTDVDGSKDFTVEKVLASRIDEPAAPVFQTLRQGRYPLQRECRGQLARFISAQLVRGRLVRENLSRAMSEVARRMISLAAQQYSDEQWERAIGEVPSADQKERLIDSERHFEIVPTNAALLGTLLANVEEIADMLGRRSWTLVQFDEPGLFTGEHPVVYINPSGHPMGDGVATADQIYLPISTTKALLLSHPWSDWPEELVNGTIELARRLNWATLIFPPNEHLLMHPDIESHPLPGVAILGAGQRWPWPDEDSGGRAPVVYDYLEAPALRTVQAI